MAAEQGTSFGTPKPATYQLADLIVDTGTREVFRGTECIALPDLSFSLLVVLLRAAPNLVTYDEMMREVWAGSVVSPETITQRVKMIRDALGDDARAPRYIAGIRSRGYRIVAPVTVSHVQRGVASRAAAIESAGYEAVDVDLGRPTSSQSTFKVLATTITLLALFAGGGWLVSQRNTPPGEFEHPSILVLPFVNLSAVPGTEYFAAGVHEDVLSRLSRIEGLKVISRTTALALARSNASIPEMAEEAGVARILEGSIRRDESRIRLTVQLISAPEENQMWAESYDRELSDLFSLQEELAQSIAEQLRIRLDPKIIASFSHAPTKSIEAYDLVVRATESQHAGRDDLATRIAWLERAIALDPSYADAYATLASVEFPNEGPRWKEIRPSAISNIEKALAIDPENALALTAMSYVVTRDGLPVAKSLPYLARAIAAAPGNPMVHRMYGNRLNNYKERLRHWEEAYRLDPLDPTAVIPYVAVLLERDRLDDALRIARKALQRNPQDPALVDTIGNVYLERGEVLSGLRQKRRAVDLNPSTAILPSGSHIQASPTYVRVLLNLGLFDIASQWLDAIESSPDLRVSTHWSRAMSFFLQNDTEALSRYLDNWPTDVGNVRLNPDYFRALLEARRADEAFDRGNPVARSAHLTRAIEHFAALFAAFPEVETPGVRAFAFPGVVTWTLLRYATVAQYLGDETRAQRTISHLERILRDQIAREAALVDRAMLAAFVGDIASSLALLERAGVRLDYFLVYLDSYGVMQDREGVFHGLAAEPRFKALVDASRARRRDLVDRIAHDAPELLDPGDAFRS